MTIRYTPQANDDLGEIISYNVRHRGAVRAAACAEFLKACIEELGDNPLIGQSLERHPHLRRLVCNWRSGGDGHVVIYSLDVEADEVEILALFHTKMDRSARLPDPGT